MSYASTPTERSPVRPFAEAAMTWLAQRIDEWPDDRESDEMNDLVGQALDAVVPKGDTLWRMFADAPPLRLLQPPGAIAGTLEEVLRDALKQDEEVERIIWHWVDAMPSEPAEHGATETPANVLIGPPERSDG